MLTISKFFHDGGALMYVNLLVAVVSLAVVSERLYMFVFRLRVNTRVFMAEIEKLINAGNFDKAIKQCSSLEGAAVPRVIRAALINARLGGPAVTSALEEAMLEVTPAVTKRSGILWAIANIATLIGLVGTVFGLITAFSAMSFAAPDQKSALLTQGIAHAMNNTAFGLSIALVCVVFHMILSILSRNLLEAMDHAAVRVDNILAKRRLQSGGREQGSAPAAAQA
jgi:biopolymer transport protein ExbB/TolQ